VENASTATLTGFVIEAVEAGAVVHTDGWNSTDGWPSWATTTAPAHSGRDASLLTTSTRSCLGSTA
jgi:hypothetical protein